MKYRIMRLQTEEMTRFFAIPSDQLPVWQNAVEITPDSPVYRKVKRVFRDYDESREYD